MASRKPPKRLFKNKEVIHSYQHDRETQTGMKHMTRDHLDVLQNIEFTLVTRARHDLSIDDNILDRALRICMNPVESEDDSDPRVVELCAALEAARAFREDVPEKIWRAGLRTVDDSVRRHSDLGPGEKSYLQFVEPYIK
jgi:hypothetical protein